MKFLFTSIAILWLLIVTACGGGPTGGKKTLVALDASDGHELWRVHPSANVLRRPHVVAGTLVVDGSPLDSCSDLAEYEFDYDIASGRAQSNKHVTPTDPGRLGTVDIADYPLAVGDIQVFQEQTSTGPGGPPDTRFRIVDVTNGNELWHADFRPFSDVWADVTVPPIVFDGNQAFYFRTAGVLRAADIHTGEPRWEMDTAAGAVGAGGGLVIVAAGDRLSAFSVDGASAWSILAAGALYPTASDNTVYYVTRGHFSSKCGD